MRKSRSLPHCTSSVVCGSVRQNSRTQSMCDVMRQTINLNPRRRPAARHGVLRSLSRSNFCPDYGFDMVKVPNLRCANMRKSAILIGFVIMAVLLYAQDARQPASQGDLSAATESMSHGHHHMGAHMQMSALRDPQPGDQEKAQTVVDQVRPAL